MNDSLSRNFTVFGIMGEAWRSVKGAKLAILAPLFIFLACYFLALILFVTLFVVARMYSDTHVPLALIGIGILAGLLLFYLVFCLLGSSTKAAIERARGKNVTLGTGFQAFSRVKPIFLTAILFVILMLPQQLLPHLTGLDPKSYAIISLQTLYGLVVGIFVFMAIPLAVDKIDSPFTAYTLSIKAMKPHFFKMVGLFFIIYIVVTAWFVPLFAVLRFSHDSSLKLLTGLAVFLVNIYLMPWLFLIQATVYHKLFD